MKSRKLGMDDLEFYREYPSAWQRHRGGACTLRCHYCVQANKFRGLTWTFIPAENYDAYLKAKRREAIDRGERVKPAGRISIPKMIQVPFMRRGA